MRLQVDHSHDHKGLSKYAMFFFPQCYQQVEIFWNSLAYDSPSTVSTISVTAGNAKLSQTK